MRFVGDGKRAFRNVLGEIADAFESAGDFQNRHDVPEIVGDGLTPGANPFVDANFIPPIRPLFASGKFNPNGTTVTVTNRFVGDLMVSKVVAGSPSSNIAIYELQLSCNDGAVKDSFLLKHGQTWLRTGLLLGWSCVVAETRSDGAEVSFADNSGANATDGKVTIKATPSGCTDSNLSNFPDCRANIVVTNSYSVPSQSPTVSPTVPPTVPLVPVVGSTTPVISVTSAPVAAAPVDEPAMLDPSEETVA